MPVVKARQWERLFRSSGLIVRHSSFLNAKGRKDDGGRRTQRGMRREYVSVRKGKVSLHNYRTLYFEMGVEGYNHW